MLRRTARKGGKSILLGWNRGLGDIALGLFAIVHRIREIIPDATITFLTRPNLREGFSMLENVRVLVVPDWKRGEVRSVRKMLAQIGVDPDRFDLIIEKPSPTDWVQWQRGHLVPRLRWDPASDSLWKAFDLPEEYTYICVQPVAETNYGLWRNWPLSRWHELFALVKSMKKVKVILFGYGTETPFQGHPIVDLRGKTTLFQLLSIVKNRCKAAVLPDSGILSMIYYLDASFPFHLVSLWADPNHGVLKQGVFSPNPQLVHSPLIGERRDLSSVSAQEVVRRIFPASPLMQCPEAFQVSLAPVRKTGAILLAGGQGSRLGSAGPKGIFPIREKSLFQWICERLPQGMPLAVMTSPLNHVETAKFFERHSFFGREVHFFQQDLLPMLDEEKKPTGLLAPDGNGSVFKSFAQSGLLSLFEERGIDLVSVVPVENPLADPADPIFLSYLQNRRADAVVKCVERKPKDVSMGALVTREGRLEIVEYTELDPSMDPRYSYIGMMAFTLSFMKRMAAVDLPLHWVWKKAGDRFAWKGERFLFDSLPFADEAAALCYPREKVYAPLKSKENLEEILRLLNHGQETTSEIISR